MSDIQIRKVGQTGRITLSRPKALNALSWDMCREIEAALDLWADDNDVKMLVIDAEGDKAFCAGGDIADLYDRGRAGDFEYGQRFWADEYRMNAKMFEFPKPVAAFLQGFTMGGGVGVACHGSHRVVGESSQIAMPEVGIGLVPDVGGSLILARAPGRLGEYLGLTASRLSAGDAIAAGFADYFIPEADWADLIQKLEETGDHSLIDTAAYPAPVGAIAAQQAEIDTAFGGERLQDIVNTLRNTDSEFATKTLKTLSRNSPLAMACALELIRRNRLSDNIRSTLEQEYRFTSRATEHGEFLEGIRAAIIDKDRKPQWQHSLEQLPTVEVAQMLLPLGESKLRFEEGEDA